ncbi:kinase-like protein [Ramaria rubella]|nr:kinase-like protein [Ramaria rubella]
MSDGDLHKYMMGHPDANVLELMADVARGLAYVHSVGIVYGNLRMTTVLVSNMGRAYLSSFLFAHTQDEDGGRRSRSVSGDFAVKFLDWRVISSSVLESDASPVSSLTVESDVFAFGTTMIEAFTVPHPNYKRVMTMRLLQNKLPERPRFIVNNGLTDDLWNLATSCWQEDATLRPMIAEIARKMVQLTEESAPREGTKLSATPRMLNNISAEIRKTSEHPIAGGGYCDLYLGERLGSEKVALKLVRLFGSTDTDRDAARRRFLSEARIWADLKHPRILEFYGICEYGTMSLFMVSPFLSNGNIMHYLSNVAPGANRRRLLLETAQGLHYLHNRRPPVIHGDLKGANILISNTGSAVLADFGLSRISHEATTAMLHGAGSPRWMAPELITAGDEETGPLKTQMTDVYAYGHIMLEVRVLGGCKPFFNFREDLHVIVELIHGRRSPRPSGPIADTWLDDPVWAYCQTCTAINPDDRPDMETVIADLSVILIS